MDNKNYYQTIISKINSCIVNQAWEEALALTEDELKVSYIPKIYLDQFNSLHAEIVSQLKQQTNAKHVNNLWTLAQITDVMTNSTDEEKHAVSFYHLQKHNVRLILPVIKAYLINNLISNINKTDLLYLLKSQDINEDLSVIKNNHRFLVNPSKLVVWKETKSYQKVNHLLAEIVAIDNPGIYQICCFLLNRYYQSLLPDIPSIKHCNAIAAAIYVRACSLQFIKVTLLASASKFHSTTKLIKLYLLDINKHKIT